MSNVLTRAEMRQIFKSYCDQVHKRAKHRAATLAVIETYWRTSRAKRRDGWAPLSKHNVGKKNEPITAQEIKSAFREFLTGHQLERCCYCRQWLFRMAHAKPIEHVLPKKNYPHFSLHFWNLAIACADCNRLKGKDVWGSVPTKRFAYPHPGECHDMFHPRFHKYDDHVQFVHVATNQGSISIYKGVTPQGRHLCTALLHKVAAERMLLDAAPQLNSSINTIEAYRTQLDGGSPKLEAFMAAFDKTLLNTIA